MDDSLNPFALDTADPDAARKKKLSLFGLGGLQQYANAPSEDLQEQPLYGGEISKGTQVSEEPSQLATERVQRAPASQESSPLLPPEERLGNVLSGEEGSYGPLTGEQRSVSLKDFFGEVAPASASGTAAEGGEGSVEGDVGGAGDNTPSPQLQQTRQAIGFAKSGKSAAETLKKLFSSAGGGASGPAYPGGLSLTGGEASGAQFPQGLSLTGGENLSPALDPGDFSLYGGGAEGAASGIPYGAVAGTGLGAASLLALIASIAQSGQASPAQITGLIQSLGGTSSGLASLLGPAAAGSTGTALSGTLGPAATGLLGSAGSALGGVGAVAGLGMGLHQALSALHAADEDPRQYASAGGVGLGTGVGTLLGGLASSWSGPGMLLGAGAGAGIGGALGGLVAKNLPKTGYMAQQSHLSEVAQDALNQYTWGIEAAGQSGDLGSLAQALGQRGSDGHVQAYLSLPEGIAQAAGIPSQASFADLSPEGFLTLLKAFSERPPEDTQGWVLSSGDIPGLEQGGAVAVSGQAKNIAMTTLKTVADQLKPYLDQMPSVDPEGLAYAESYRAQAPQREEARLSGLRNQYSQTYGSGDLQPQTPEAWDLYNLAYGRPWQAGQG